MSEKETKNTQSTENTTPENVEIEPLSENDLDSIAGGTVSQQDDISAMCSMVGCS